MLTRIEIDGFKSFSDFELDFRPLSVVLGPNAAGKSNLLDAIQLLSRVVSQRNINEALMNLRGQPHELFRMGPNGEPENTMTFAVEVLLDSKVTDPYGATVDLPYTRLRYELVIERNKNSSGVERIQVAKENVEPLQRNKDRLYLETGGENSPFNKIFMKRSNRRRPYIHTTEEDELPIFQILQEGHGGAKRTLPNVGAEATVLSSITSSKEFPTLFGLREELSSWRYIQLDPVDLRKSSATMADDNLDMSGKNLPTVLSRIRAETKTDVQGEGVLADITADLIHLIPGVKGISVEEDKKNREYYVEIQMRNSPPFSARLVSDGTLRILALLTLLHDPRHRGLVCFEEPENGVHPYRLREMIRTFRSLVTNLEENEYDEDEPLRQVIFNSHSPVVLSCLDEREMTFIDIITSVDPEAKESKQRTHARKVKLQGDFWPSDKMNWVSAFEVEKFLNSSKREAL